MTFSKSLPASIVRQETYSGGQSRHDFATPWGHGTISRTATPFDRVGRLHGTLTGWGYDVSFTETATAEEAARRVMAHVMVFVMPPEGLDEAVSCLWDIIEFHKDRVEVALAPIDTRSVVGRGRVVEVTERSPLTLGD
ncbi:MAG TPA: hypothetical protein VGR43_02560 [Dehalococcoidia bacterium]|jgi:hypothetical protein|nr:hypothetical protein [Dehalococcoidia bacterium]